MSASNQIETIDAYLKGELSPEEARVFESQLKTDPKLSEELAFQKQVVSGIQQARKLQLKNRLAQVDVAGASVSGQATWIKVVGGVAIATIIGVATWQLLPDESATVQIGEIDAPTQEVLDIPAVKVPERRLVEEKHAPEPVVVPVPEPVSADDNIILTPKSDSEAKLAESTEVEEFAPQVELPSGESELNSGEFEPDELGETFSNNAIVSSEIDALNIERYDLKAKALRYRYYDGKLALYGDFGSSPYQILEINQQDGARQIFLLHADEFYRLESTKNEQDLVAIKDPALLNELQILQNRK